MPVESRPGSVTSSTRPPRRSRASAPSLASTPAPNCTLALVLKVKDCIASLLAGRRLDHVELDPLRQRQRATVIHRAGLPAHIGFPCVRTALAPAPRFLLAAERAPDLPPRGP